MTIGVSFPGSSIASATLPAALSQAAAAPTSATRPAVDWWEAGGTRYEGTSDLMSKLKVEPGGTDATYHFKTSARTIAPERGWDTALGAGGGAIAGTFVGGIAAAAVGFLGIVGSVMTAGFFGVAGAPPIVGLLLGGAAIGAVVGGRLAHSSPQADESSAIPGKILPETRPDGNHLTFSPGGNLNSPVDLNAYAGATPPSPVPSAPPQAAWKDAVKGAAMATVVPFVPVAGLIAPTGVGSKYGALADASHPSRGAVIGGALGAAATIGAITAEVVGSVPLLIATAGTLAITGAILGPRVLPAVRQDRVESSAQPDEWWNRATASRGD